MIRLHIAHTGRGYGKDDKFSCFEKSDHDFPDIQTARKWLKKQYGKCKRTGMFSDGKNGEAKHIGYVYSFHNSDISHVPVEKWIQQDWVEFQEIKTITPTENHFGKKGK